MPANNRTGDLPSLPRIFPHYPARTRTRDGAPEHAELAPGSDDATKKLDAKGRPVDFKELLRIQRHYQRPQVRARIEGAGLIWRAAVSCRSRRSSGHYRWQEGAAVRFAPEETCPVLAFARSLDQLDQRAQGQVRRDPRRHLRASNLRAERRGRPRPCESKGGDPDDDRRGSLP